LFTIVILKLLIGIVNLYVYFSQLNLSGILIVKKCFSRGVKSYVRSRKELNA
jgi:hypothetical protein